MTNFNWYFSRDEIDNRSPSREDGVPLATEIRYRREGARLIINASNTLGLRYETTATGVVFFHRFFMLQSFRQFSRWVVAAACLLLAGKVEETPKKCRDIIKVCQSLLNEHQMSHFGSNPKEELTTHERILLQTIKFDLQVEHPYTRLLKFAKQLSGEKAKIEKLVQMAWTFVNDSLCTSLCLQWEPQAVAIAFIYLAGKLSKFDLVAATHSKTRSWWRQYLDTLDVHDLESICHQVLDIYGEEEKSGEESGPASDSATPQPTSTSHQVSSSPVSSSTHHHSQQAQPPYPPTPGTVTPRTPHMTHQQFAAQYQQLMMSGANIPQHSPHLKPLFPTIGQNVTPPLVPTHPLSGHTQSAPPGHAQPANTPLAYSTLNVNVSSQPHPGGAAPLTGSYPYPTPGGVARGATTPSGSVGLQPKSFATGANAYPIQSYNKAMSSFVGSGQVGVARPLGVTPTHLGGARVPPAVRGSVTSTPPRAPHGLSHVRSAVALGYPGTGQTPHGTSAPHAPPTHTGGGGATAQWPHP